MGTHPIFESDFDCLTENVTKVTKMSDLEAYTWTEYEVDFDESLLSISVKFDTSIQLLKRKNKIGSDADLWLGRRIMVPDDTCSLLPHEPPVPPMPALKRQTTTTRSSPDPEDQDPEHIGFIKLDAFRLRLEDDQIIALSKVNHTEQIGGVLLVTPSAVMFDPSAPTTPELGLIIPINDVKRAALYNVNNNSRISWLQISSRETVAYFGVSVDNATPILRCLQKWSSAKFVATPGVLRRDTRTITGDRETPDLAICHSSLELHHNEEFFTETETEWQIEEGVRSMEKSENDEMRSKDGSEIRETLDQAARIMPEMSASSHILNRDQIINLNNLLPARCIGATWHLRYSTRQNGTSLKTLVQKTKAEKSLLTRLEAGKFGDFLFPLHNTTYPLTASTDKCTLSMNVHNLTSKNQNDLLHQNYCNIKIPKPKKVALAQSQPIRFLQFFVVFSIKTMPYADIDTYTLKIWCYHCTKEKNE